MVMVMVVTIMKEVVIITMVVVTIMVALSMMVDTVVVVNIMVVVVVTMVEGNMEEMKMMAGLNLHKTRSIVLHEEVMRINLY